MHHDPKTVYLLATVYTTIKLHVCLRWLALVTGNMPPRCHPWPLVVGRHRHPGRRQRHDNPCQTTIIRQSMPDGRTRLARLQQATRHRRSQPPRGRRCWLRTLAGTFYVSSGRNFMLYGGDNPYSISGYHPCLEHHTSYCQLSATLKCAAIGPPSRCVHTSGVIW